MEEDPFELGSLRALHSDTLEPSPPIPVYSLYRTEDTNDKDGSNNKKKGVSVTKQTSLDHDARSIPDRLLDQVDTIVIDLQDIGCRVYTYMWTAALVIKRVAAYNSGDRTVSVVVLDRPNPLGLSSKAGKSTTTPEGKKLSSAYGGVGGHVLDPKQATSFVGWMAIPLCHGLTMGELVSWFVLSEGLNAKQLGLHIVKCEGLSRPYSPPDSIGSFFPSPNMPSLRSARLFPAYVMLEATSVSEGRGSTCPFQVLGCPGFSFIRWATFFRRVGRWLSEKQPDGPFAKMNSSFAFTPFEFCPTFDKYTGQKCQGVLVTVVSMDHGWQHRVYALGVLSILYFSLHHSKNSKEEKDGNVSQEALFKFRPTSAGYEYNFETPALTLVTGTECWIKLFSKLCEKAKNEEPDKLFGDAMLAVYRNLVDSQTQSEKWAMASEKVWMY